MTTGFRFGRRWLAVAVLAIASHLGAGIAFGAHPLDPLTADEIRTATQVIKADGRFATASLPFMSIADPPKAEVLAWQASQTGQGPQASQTPATMSRRAHVMAITPAGLFEVVVDVQNKRIVSANERKGAQGPVSNGESGISSQVALSDPRFQAGLKARGIDPTKIFCAPWTAGNYNVPAWEGKRVLMVGCFDTRRVTNNSFGWPIERLYALVDVGARKAIEVVDGGAVPLSPSNQNFRDADISDVRNQRNLTLLAQPQGVNYKVDGHEVSWGNWRFHVRVDPRVGPVISLARWQDKNGLRSVLYQGHLSEMFVPYMDPAFGWYSRTFFDAGEYGAGLMASRMRPGVDCPANATFMPATLSADSGAPMTTPNAMCIFERDRGEAIWRHGPDGRRDVELVVRMTAEIGNYDYILDWVFDDAAEIEVRVGATGIVALKGVPTQKMTDATAAEDTKYGNLIAPGLVGTSHDHHFNFRLDMDVDGTANSIEREVYQKVMLPPTSPRRSIYVVKPQIAETEKTAQIDMGHSTEKLMVVNEGKTNGVGNPVGYELLMSNHGEFLLDPSDSPAKRAKFLGHDVWVTHYDPAELHGAGDYIFGTREAAGLPVWVQKNRPVRKQDIVIWANVSLNHLVRAEDQPVMPTLWHSFTIRPFNFFDRNPALDIRPEQVPASTMR